MSSESSSEIFGAQWAGRLCVALLVGLGIVTGVAFYDEHRCSQLEATAENSAVGDKAFFPIPAEAAPEQATAPLVVNFNGKALTAVSSRNYEERDSKMIRVGMEDSKRFSVYTSTEAIKPLKGEMGNAGGEVYFLKTGPGKYLKFK